MPGIAMGPAIHVFIGPVDRKKTVNFGNFKNFCEKEFSPTTHSSLDELTRTSIAIVDLVRQVKAIYLAGFFFE